MAGKGELDVRLELANPGELIAAPSRPARRPAARGIGHGPGPQSLRPRPSRRVRATLVLPSTARAPDLEARCRAALERFCDAKIAWFRNDLSSLWHEGWATLARGLLFLALCMLGSQLVGEPKILHPVVARFLDEGFVIAGWVALWYPLDVLLYQHWTLVRERKMYEGLRKMELAFEYVG